MRRKLNLVELTGLPFDGAFFGGGYDIATFAADQSTLVVAYEKRLTALDRAFGGLLWSADPGSFPHDPFPVLDDGTLFFTAAVARTPKTSPAESDAGCACSTARIRSRGGAMLLASLLVAARSRRSRVRRGAGSRGDRAGEGHSHAKNAPTDS